MAALELTCQASPFGVGLGSHAADSSASAAVADQIIDARAAQGLHAYADRTFAMVGWVVTRDTPGHPGKMVARLMTDDRTPYVLVADSLTALRAQLPPALVCSERLPCDPPGVVEAWFSEPA